MTRHVLSSALRTAAICAAAAIVAGGCGSDPEAREDDAGGPGSRARLTLVAHSAPREAFEEIIPRFQETAAGRHVEFDQGYGSSGDQSRAVEGGLRADLVHLALGPDLTRLVDKGLVAREWNDNPHEGIVTSSVVVLVVREGNPRNIADWDDLLVSDIDVVTPNPFTSGGARWNLMAAYGAWRRGGDSRAEALDKMERLLRNTPVQSTSAREALQVFTRGKGDVLLSYENEAITAQDKGQDVEFVVPDATILVENPGAVLDRSESPEAARAFLDYLWTDEAQRIFAEKGYRPVTEEVLEEFDFDAPDDLFTIADLGGWDTVMDEFFDRDDGEVAEIARGLGDTSND